MLATNESSPAAALARRRVASVPQRRRGEAAVRSSVSDEVVTDASVQAERYLRCVVTLLSAARGGWPTGARPTDGIPTGLADRYDVWAPAFVAGWVRRGNPHPERTKGLVQDCAATFVAISLDLRHW
jgi:hypothetical protein